MLPAPLTTTIVYDIALTVTATEHWFIQSLLYWQYRSLWYSALAIAETNNPVGFKCNNITRLVKVLIRVLNATDSVQWKRLRDVTLKRIESYRSLPDTTRHRPELRRYWFGRYGHRSYPIVVPICVRIIRHWSVLLVDNLRMYRVGLITLSTRSYFSARWRFLRP